MNEAQSRQLADRSIPQLCALRCVLACLGAPTVPAKYRREKAAKHEKLKKARAANAKRKSATRKRPADDHACDMQRQPKRRRGGSCN